MLDHALPAATPARRESPADNGVGELTAGLIAGDEDAFRAFHRRFHDRAWRYLLVLCRGDEHAAKEALQDTWLRVARCPRPCPTEMDLWRWLSSVARSAAVDGARRRLRYHGAIARYEATLQRHGDPCVCASDPLDRLDALLEEGMKELPELERLLLAARYRAGRSVRDLAAEHHVSEKAMESRLARLRAHLRRRLLQRLAHEDVA
jgi:RNA polymerase sigma factor (sigma-70 family)